MERNETAAAYAAAAATAVGNHYAAVSLLTADALARVARAATAATSTYRGSRYGFTAEEVEATAIADMLTEYAAGSEVPTDSVAVAVRCRRIADRLRRAAERETASGTAAETVDPRGTRGDGSKQIAAALSKRGSIGSVKRTDVLGVADYSRQMMRAAEVCAMESMRAAALADAEQWQPLRDAETAAWRAMLETAAAVEVPSRGVGSAADDAMHCEQETAGRKVGRERVFVVAAGSTVAAATAADRRAMRAAVRAAETAEIRAESALAAADDAETATAARAALRDAETATAALRLARHNLPSREVVPTVEVIYRAATVAAVIPAATATALDRLGDGYAAEELADRVGSRRAGLAAVEVPNRDGSTRSVCCPSRLASRDGSRASSGRDWLLKSPRRLEYVEVLPAGTAAARAALGRAARGYADHLTAAATAAVAPYRGAAREIRETARG